MKVNLRQGQDKQDRMICGRKEGGRSAVGHCQVLGQAAASLLHLRDKYSLRKGMGKACKK